MKFILTQELGRLSKWLRILGFDAQYFHQSNLSALIIQALRDDRIILTRNHRVPHSGGIKIAMIEEEELKRQIAEVMAKLHIQPNPEMMFTRCILCNIGLVAVKKEEIKPKVPEYVFKAHEDFISCPNCQRIYWPGTHWGNVTKMLKEIELSV